MVYPSPMVRFSRPIAKIRHHKACLQGQGGGRKEATKSDIIRIVGSSAPAEKCIAVVLISQATKEGFVNDVGAAGRRINRFTVGR